MILLHHRRRGSQLGRLLQHDTQLCVEGIENETSCSFSSLFFFFPLFFCHAQKAMTDIAISGCYSE